MPVNAVPSSSSVLARCASKPGQRGDAGGEESEAARDQCGQRAVGAHRRHQLARALGQTHALPGLLQRVERQTPQHRDPLAQRVGEVDLSVHAASGDRGDPILQAGEVGEFVQRLAGDDGAVHVGDQQPLAPSRDWGGDGIHAGAHQHRRDRVHVRRGGEGMSTASPGASMSGFPPPTASRTWSINSGRNGGAAADEGQDLRHDAEPASGRGGQAPALIVSGPTASGKSALAVALAERMDGVIVNADSMQVYRELRVLTARPTVEEEAAVPHGPVWRAPGRGGVERRLVAGGGAGRDGGGPGAGAGSDPVRRDRLVFRRH